MDKAIDTISTFLTDQLDGTAARMVAAAARSVLTADKISSRLDTRQQFMLSQPAATREPLTRESMVRGSTMVGTASGSRRPQSRLTVNSLSMV